MSANFYHETVAGLKLLVTDTIQGPMPWLEGEQEPLAWFVTLAVKGDIPDAIAKIERGEDAGDGAAVSACRPSQRAYGTPYLAKLQAKWKSLTGTDPGDDIYIAGASFLEDSFLIPRAALLEILIKYTTTRIPREKAK